MKVSEKTLNIWAVVSLTKEREFQNPNFVGSLDLMDRIVRIKETDHWKLRIWKEYFFKFSESQRGEQGYIPDA